MSEGSSGGSTIVPLHRRSLTPDDVTDLTDPGQPMVVELVDMSAESRATEDTTIRTATATLASEYDDAGDETVHSYPPAPMTNVAVESAPTTTSAEATHSESGRRLQAPSLSSRSSSYEDPEVYRTRGLDVVWVPSEPPASWTVSGTLSHLCLETLRSWCGGPRVDSAQMCMLAGGMVVGGSVGLLAAAAAGANTLGKAAGMGIGAAVPVVLLEIHSSRRRSSRPTTEIPMWDRQFYGQF